MKRVKTFIYTFILWTAVGLLGRLFFLAYYGGILTDVTATEHLQSLLYGLRLDTAIAGYLTLLPGLMLIASLWYRGRPLRYLWRGYFILTSLLVALAYVANIGLYGYWGFPLDSTPLLYLRTSPADAVASLTPMQMVLAVVALLACTCAIAAAHIMTSNSLWRDRHSEPAKVQSSIFSAILLLLLTAMLIIPIRGGFGTGTNHTGSVYFSSNIRLNHATVNPVFSFMESALHREEIGSKYRFMGDEEATAIFSKMTAAGSRDSSITVPPKTNVILITLESFSKYIMTEAGHVKGVTPCLDSISREGLYFMRFYANTFRTDRALVAIHSALPAQTTMSIMDQPRKSTVLPSIARTLSANGYATAFYYGGDINYSNMRSYFVGTGFQRIVSDTDFPARQRTGKWGVADGPVYDRILADIEAGKSGGKPFFISYMTSSSHEPFDVPDYNKIPASPELNAFSYADACLGRFISEIKTMPCWGNTLIVILADHLGVLPKEPDNYELWRYDIPLIITGGALPQEMTGSNATVGCQTDIAATLLALLGYGHEDFPFSKDMLDPAAPHFAFFTFPDAMGLITANGSIIYDNTTGKTVRAQGDTTMLTRQSQAYLQKLYDYIEEQ